MLTDISKNLKGVHRKILDDSHKYINHVLLLEASEETPRSRFTKTACNYGLHKPNSRLHKELQIYPTFLEKVAD